MTASPTPTSTPPPSAVQNCTSLSEAKTKEINKLALAVFTRCAPALSHPLSHPLAHPCTPSHTPLHVLTRYTPLHPTPLRPVTPPHQVHAGGPR